MHPILVKWGPITIYSYGLAMAVAFLTVIGLARRAAARDLAGHVPMQPDALIDWACWTIIGGMLGGRLLYLILNWHVYAAEPLEIVAVWHGGLIWYGGFAGGLLAQGLYFRRRGIAFLRGTDQVIPFATLGHAIGRLGCFTNGCCFGVPTSAWWGVQFPGQASRVVPTQLLEAAALGALFLILRALQTPERLRRPGTLFGSYLIGYAVIRWNVERWRAHQPIVGLGWTLHQWISVGLFGVGWWLLARRRSHGAT